MTFSKIIGKLIGYVVGLALAIYLVGHIKQLEQLCRDMYETMHYLDPRHVYEYYTKRMEELGLLEGEQ